MNALAWESSAEVSRHQDLIEALSSDFYPRLTWHKGSDEAARIFLCRVTPALPGKIRDAGEIREDPDSASKRLAVDDKLTRFS